MRERQNDGRTEKQIDITLLNKCDRVTMIISQFQIFKSLSQWGNDDLKECLGSQKLQLRFDCKTFQLHELKMKTKLTDRLNETETK